MVKQNEYKNPKRIVKNTAYLYVRMFVLMIVSLFTSRLVLRELGVTDYGLYNVIGGMITIFSFLKVSMGQASQRFIVYEMGRGNMESLKSVFSTSVYIHIGIALLIALLGETVGLWYVYNVAVIPSERFFAALWVYHCSIVVSCVSVITVPYNALITGHEHMSAYALIAIVEAVLKLGAVCLLIILPTDNLITYGVAMASLAILMQLFNGMYASRKFPESKLVRKIDIKKIRSMGGFASWSLWGSLAAAGYSQGLNMIINLFFNPAVNAARGVAVTVQALIRSFSANFQLAVNPQITKSYAAGDLPYVYTIIRSASIFTYFLFFLVGLPVMIEIDSLLGLWLVEVPEHASNFIRILLMISAVEILASPLNVSAQATGKIRNYEVITGIILLLIVPISYLVLSCRPIPECVFLVFLVQTCLAFVARVVMLKHKINLPVRSYARTILSLSLVSAVSLILPFWVHHVMSGGLLRIVCVTLANTLITPCAFYTLALNVSEKWIVLSKCSQFISKHRCNQKIG